MPIFDLVRKRPDHVLCIDDQGHKIFNRELLAAAERVKDRIGRQLVFVLCKNRPGSLMTYLASLMGGAVPLLLDGDIAPELLEKLYDNYRPAAIGVPEEVLPLYRKLLPVPAQTEKLYDTQLLLLQSPGPALHPDLCLLLTTSGSTGSPKLVRISRDNLVSNAAAICEYLEINSDERPITTLPMHYSYGMSVINSHVYAGATILLTQYTLMEQAFWDRLEGEKASSLAGVPYTYQMLKRLDLTGRALPALKTLTQAGGKLPESLQKYFGSWCQETGRRFFVMYGQTEASPRMGYLPPEHVTDKAGSMGIAIPGGHFQLSGEDGRIISDAFDTGQLIYQGPNVSMGYAEKSDDLIRGDENGGILKTGDMAYRDQEGFYYITGRMRRFIKLLGKRISLDETESLLQSAFPDLTCACVGRDDHLSIYISGVHVVTEQMVTDYLVRTLHLPGAMVKIRQIPEIPRTASGKKDYQHLLQM